MCRWWEWREGSRELGGGGGGHKHTVVLGDSLGKAELEDHYEQKAGGLHIRESRGGRVHNKGKAMETAEPV